MSRLKDMLRKARAAVVKRGVSRGDAEDLVQEAFLKVEQYERRHAVRSREALLVTTAVNLSIDGVRRERRAPFVGLDGIQAMADAAPGPEEIVRAQARLRRAAEGLDNLSERSRRILLSRRLGGMSYAKIAEAENMSIAAVEKQVARATLQLVKWMDGW